MFCLNYYMETKKYPDPNRLYTLKDSNMLIFLKNDIKSKKIIVGDYTVSATAPGEFEKNVLHHHLNDKLIIGKFSGFAPNVRFLMAAIHHNTTDCFTIYGFCHIEEWKNEFWNDEDFLYRGDTIVGNNVFVGRDSVIFPGVHIGDGAIIGACSVVTKDVPPYTIVGGNPAKVIKKRLDDETIDLLLKIKWWDWNIETITENIHILKSKNKNALFELAKNMGYIK